MYVYDNNHIAHYVSMYLLYVYAITTLAYTNSILTFKKTWQYECMQDDGSEYSPSELSAAIAAEGQDYDDDDNSLIDVRKHICDTTLLAHTYIHTLYRIQQQEDDEYENMDEEEIDDNERLQEMKVDSVNIKIQVMVLGDSTNFPVIIEPEQCIYTVCMFTEMFGMIHSVSTLCISYIFVVNTYIHIFYAHII